MFYAIAKRRRDLNAAEDKGHKKGLVEGRAEGRMEGRAEGRMEGRAEGRMEGRAEGRMEGRAEGRMEAHAEGGVAVLDALAGRLSEPGADPMAVIAQMRAELRNGAGQQDAGLGRRWR